MTFVPPEERRSRAIEDRKLAKTRIERLNRVYAVLSGVNQAIVRIRDTQTLFSEAACTMSRSSFSSIACHES